MSSVLWLTATIVFLWWVFAKSGHREVSSQRPGSLLSPIKLTMEMVIRHSYSPKAEDNLLSRFEKGWDVSDIAEYWDDKLGESRLAMVERFQRDGLIEPMPLPEKLRIVFNLAELKPMCKERGLKVSGKKMELAKRLTEADSSGMLGVVGGKKIMWLTPAGKSRMMEYYAREADEYETAQDKILGHLRDGNLTDAIAVSRQYKSNMLWPSGCSEEFDMNVLSGILASPLGGRDERFLAALMHLLPESYPGKWHAQSDIKSLLR
ncbi:MAG: SAP domain-containing protein [Pseudomonadota bacterium]